MLYGNAEIKDGFVLLMVKNYPYDKLIIATGSHAFIPPIKGVEYAKTYKDMLDYKEVPEKLIIIGSGTIATELAGIILCNGHRSPYTMQRDFLERS